MPTTTADQSATGGAVLWSTVRSFSGTVKANITDITITSRNADGIPHEKQFAYADYEIALYWRAGANSQILGVRGYRKWWGASTGWWPIGGSLPAGNYSFRTKLIGAYNSDGTPLSYGWSPWVAATFDFVN